MGFTNHAILAVFVKHFSTISECCDRPRGERDLFILKKLSPHCTIFASGMPSISKKTLNEKILLSESSPCWVKCGDRNCPLKGKVICRGVQRYSCSCKEFTVASSWKIVNSTNRAVQLARVLAVRDFLFMGTFRAHSARHSVIFCGCAFARPGIDLRSISVFF